MQFAVVHLQSQYPVQGVLDGQFLLLDVVVEHGAEVAPVVVEGLIAYPLLLLEVGEELVCYLHVALGQQQLSQLVLIEPGREYLQKRLVGVEGVLLDAGQPLPVVLLQPVGFVLEGSCVLLVDEADCQDTGHFRHSEFCLTLGCKHKKSP